MGDVCQPTQQPTGEQRGPARGGFTGRPGTQHSGVRWLCLRPEKLISLIQKKKKKLALVCLPASQEGRAYRPRVCVCVEGRGLRPRSRHPLVSPGPAASASARSRAVPGRACRGGACPSPGRSRRRKPRRRAVVAAGAALLPPPLCR